MVLAFLPTRVHEKITEAVAWKINDLTRCRRLEQR